ncbi:septum site-determining protein MinC [Methyloparacoccus murrellii]
MSANPPATHSTAAVELKSGSITLPILKVHTSDLAEVDLQLAQKLGKAPEFFRHAPIIVDLGDLSASQKLELDFIALLGMLQEHALVPVGMRGGTADQQKAAQAEKIAVLAEVRAEPAPAAEAKAPERRRVPPPPRPAAASTKVIDQPVRSGQRVYASGGDLIVLAQVSPGAEIMADGNIHVYGPLKGRALAGVQGNLEARIFCSDLQAQLVAIGGHYRTSENEEDALRGKLVQIYLQDDALVIAPL